MSHQLWFGFTDPEEERVTGAKTHLENIHNVMHVTGHETITCDSYMHVTCRKLLLNLTTTSPSSNRIPASDARGGREEDKEEGKEVRRS